MKLITWEDPHKATQQQAKNMVNLIGKKSDEIYDDFAIFISRKRALLAIIMDLEIVRIKLEDFYNKRENNCYKKEKEESLTKLSEISDLIKNLKINIK